MTLHLWTQVVGKIRLTRAGSARRRCIATRFRPVVSRRPALQIIVKTGPQHARDQIVGWLEGKEIPVTDIDISARSRVFRKAVTDGMELHSFALPVKKILRSNESAAPRSRFEHRAETIRRKGLKPQPESSTRTAAFNAILNKDMAALLRSYLRLFPRQFPKRPRRAPE